LCGKINRLQQAHGNSTFMSVNMNSQANGITIVGLGPGDPAHLTLQAWQWLNQVDEVYLRTKLHPVVAGFPSTLQVHSFDDLYEHGQSFEAVYQEIVAQILRLVRVRRA
jgi:tetrapyrrole methylase family protein/MazG family protein